MFDGAYGVTKINCDPEMIEKYCGSNAAGEDKKIDSKEAAKEVAKIEKDSTNASKMEGSSIGIIVPINSSDDDAPNKRPVDDVEPTVVKKRSKRVVIKQEKP